MRNLPTTFRKILTANGNILTATMNFNTSLKNILTAFRFISTAKRNILTAHRNLLTAKRNILTAIKKLPTATNPPIAYTFAFFQPTSQRKKCKRVSTHPPNTEKIPRQKCTTYNRGLAKWGQKCKFEHWYFYQH